jgi:hypothetical protein
LSTLLDLFGYLTVVVCGLELVAQAALVGWPVGWIWPACFIGVGLVLIAYGEA